ncbi:PucR family transcriptional regulator [Streptacidiphilus jiangxiensis]|uniref:DNA-binding transcriptional regulator, PucR family n=2 Tax=Streptacidiphilus jiangxiensis TaxID=235985 RepID=A0A1H7X9Z2_STRJI|nr:helix-turn-helix domain-containing protein [Streptacidiphilus jiangxiensis]SEM29997.1 DNA-binding transcriptional regulator, PucR family [Streptacidiphilus jiangxiensis]
MSTYPARSLGRVLEDFGRTLLDLVHGDADAVGQIGGVAIFDPHDEQVFPERAIVLGVSVRSREEIEPLLRQLAARRAAALVVRAPVVDDEDLAGVVAETGVALLALTRGASWAQLAAMLRMLLAEGDVGEAGEQTLGGVPSGDLFALANAVSTLLDAPITIEDRRQRILAFSGRQDEADASRVATILARQVPEGYVRILESRGVFREIYRSSEPVHIAPATINEGETALPRVAVAVRAGDEILGSMWAAVARPLTPERETAFKEAAKLVALHMLRVRAGADAENRLRADLVATALEGGAGAGEALRRLGLAQEPTLVMALALAVPGDGDHAVVTAERQRLTSALGLHLTAVQPRSAVALLGDVAYAIVPAAGDAAVARERAVQVGAEFLQRVGGRADAVFGVGSVAAEPGALARSRANADRVLRVLAEGSSGRKVASIADVHVDALLLEMRDLAQAHGDEPSAPIARLVEYDAKHNTQLVATLRAWLDAFGDVIAASASVFVHQNTFRYRIRRVAEVSRLDLDDPAQRFAAMLELRLLDSGGGPGTGTATG